MKGDYGDKLIASLDQIVQVEVPKQIRSQRVRNRSFSRFGERILPGGDLNDKEEAWFSLTDSRPEDYTAQWLETVNCPVIHINGTLPVQQNVDDIVSAISTVHTGSYVCKIASMEEMEQKWNYANYANMHNIGKRLRALKIKGFETLCKGIQNDGKSTFRMPLKY